MRPDVVVVGGGLIGCSAAFFLAREQLSVQLLERGALGAGASTAAAGMLAPIAELDEDGPLLRLGVEGLERFPGLVAELEERSGIDVQYRRSGLLRATRSEVEAERLRARAEALAGFDLEWLDAAALRRLAPALAPDLAGALWSPREAHVRSEQLLRAYARAARACGAILREGEGGVGLLREGSRVAGVRTAAGALEAGHVVIATGSWGGELAGGLGFSLPVRPVRGQMLAVDAPPEPLGPIVWGDEAYLVPKRDDSVWVGATVEEAGFDCRVTVDGVRRLLEAAPRLVPALRESGFQSAWAGLRPATPDRLPILGPLPGLEGLTLALGHFRNGVLLSGVTGEWTARLVLGKGLPDGASAFAAERFA